MRTLFPSSSKVDSYEYDAFGNLVGSTGSTANNFLYRGEQWDPNLGLYYLRARYYNPVAGRFLSVDPLADEGEPRYEYADADPINELDPDGNEAFVEFALLDFRPAPVHVNFPNWCEVAGDNPSYAVLPGCNRPPDHHWTVRVDYRPILRWKHGKNCDEKHGIPGCHLPWGGSRHSYVEIDDPYGNGDTFGVLGVNPPKNNNQEMVEGSEGWEGNFQDPPYGAPGIQSFVVQATDQRAQEFEQVLGTHANSAYPNCPSCGIGTYHNGPFPPIDVVSFFGFFNSNTFTENVIANFLGVTTTLDHAPGYHYSPRYAGYP
jgi:RHS repeat-associated protein